MKICIVLQFPDARASTELWAFEERKIDFFHEKERAARCTISFAAYELKHHLEKTLVDAEICYSETELPDCFTIRLLADDLLIRGETYQLIPENCGICIKGRGRVGVLYGAYEFLKLQGWRWYEPGEIGEYAPEKVQSLIVPEETQTFSTPCYAGRGFSLDGQLNESEELALWMARNHLNVYNSRPNTCYLMYKLGFILVEGGHIFEDILNPDKALPSGKSIWEEHPEWYGTPETGEKVKDLAQHTQFCVSQPELLDYLSEELLNHIMDEWHEADQINVWSFDTWGGICCCDQCKALGNGTDQNLYLLSHFRSFLNQARKDNRLDRDVKLVMCLYEGSSTLIPPIHPVPQNLIDAGDVFLYAPIVRCYAHPFFDQSCSYNKEYNEALSGWYRLGAKIPVRILEYYNVSLFEDLPLLYTQLMKKDIPDYVKNGASGFCYMHIPMVNWGVRAITQLLYAELTWDPNVDIDAKIQEYFLRRYGLYADRMSGVYEKIEKATTYITSWRAFKDKSLLTILQSWNGRKPSVPLPVDDHFETPDKFEQIGDEAEQLLTDALQTLNLIIHEEKTDVSRISLKPVVVTDPASMKQNVIDTRLLHFLTEDKRGLLYGIDTLQLMLDLGKYYNALYAENTEKASQIWRRIEALEEHLDSYFFPATFDQTRLTLISKDALTRTQLRECISRCRKFRIESGLE